MSRPLSDNWRTIKVAASAGEQRLEARPSSAYEAANSDAVRAREDGAKRQNGDRVAALREEIATRIRRDLETLRQLPQQSRAKRQRIDRALREMQGV
jgi:hypothetical protein